MCESTTQAEERGEEPYIHMRETPQARGGAPVTSSRPREPSDLSYPVYSKLRTQKAASHLPPEFRIELDYCEG